MKVLDFVANSKRIEMVAALHQEMKIRQGAADAGQAVSVIPGKMLESCLRSISSSRSTGKRRLTSVT